MKQKILWVSNHPCNDDQQVDLFNRFGDHELVELNDPRWGQIDPTWGMEQVNDYLAEFIDLHGISHVVLMGELSACLCLVSWCVMLRISAWTPTTRRESVEMDTGDGGVVKRSVFRHCRLRCLHWPEKHSARCLLQQLRPDDGDTDDQ